MEMKIIQMQAMFLVLSYIVFCITINHFKPSNVYRVSSYDKIFFGLLLIIGFGVSEGIGYLLDFLTISIPKIAKKSTSRYIKGVVLNKTGRMRIQFFLLLAFMVVTSTLCISVILLQSLLSMEVLQPFFEAVSEHFIRRYCLVGVIVFYMWSMAMGRLIYYLEDAIFRDKKRENDTRLARYILIFTSAHSFKLLYYYNLCV